MKIPKSLLASINNLNFSGDEKSWFDLWHIHPLDFKRNEVASELDVSFGYLFQTYQILVEKMSNYPRDYQCWIEIDINDPDQNAVFLHSENPNSNNFPIKYPESEIPEINDSLKALIDKYELHVCGIRSMDGDLFFIYNKDAGIPLNK